MLEKSYVMLVSDMVDSPKKDWFEVPVGRLASDDDADRVAKSIARDNKWVIQQIKVKGSLH